MKIDEAFITVIMPAHETYFMWWFMTFSIITLSHFLLRCISLHTSNIKYAIDKEIRCRRALLVHCIYNYTSIGNLQFSLATKCGLFCVADHYTSLSECLFPASFWFRSDDWRNKTGFIDNSWSLCNKDPGRAILKLLIRISL